MGGLGSGRWPGESPCKETTEDYFALDIREIKRHGLIAPLAEEIPGVARLEWIPAGFGGDALRPWFLCPRTGCQRRVAILYGRPWREGHPSWACRTCLDLCYPVERENRAERAARRMNKARAKLGPGPEKPRRMRHETFVRLGREYLKTVEEYREAAREAFAHQLARMEEERIKFDL